MHFFTINHRCLSGLFTTNPGTNPLIFVTLSNQNECNKQCRTKMQFKGTVYTRVHLDHFDNSKAVNSRRMSFNNKD